MSRIGKAFSKLAEDGEELICCFEPKPPVFGRRFIPVILPFVLSFIVCSVFIQFRYREYLSGFLKAWLVFGAVLLIPVLLVNFVISRFMTDIAVTDRRIIVLEYGKRREIRLSEIECAFCKSEELSIFGKPVKNCDIDDGRAALDPIDGSDPIIIENISDPKGFCHAVNDILRRYYSRGETPAEHFMRIINELGIDPSNQK